MTAAYVGLISYINKVLVSKKQRNMRVVMEQIFEKHLKRITEIEINTYKSFWIYPNYFLSNKGFIGINNITILIKDVVTTDEKTLASTFNKHYINIVEISSGKSLKNHFKNVTWQK